MIDFQLDAGTEYLQSLKNFNLPCRLKNMRCLSVEKSWSMRTTGPFTIKQCNRVADAWSVVCGPGVRIPPLPFHSFHPVPPLYHHVPTTWRFSSASLVIVFLSLLLCCALRGSLPSSLDPRSW